MASIVEDMEKMSNEDVKEVQKAGKMLVDSGIKDMVEVSGTSRATSMAQNIANNKLLEKQSEISR